MHNQHIQFQPSMLMPEFQRCFGTEVQCTEAVERARRPDGFRCPRCAITEHCAVGRGSENRVPFVAVVSVDSNGHPLCVKFNLTSGFTSKAIGKWAQASLLPGTVVTSDGLGCFAAVADAATASVAIRMHIAREARCSV